MNNSEELTKTYLSSVCTENTGRNEKDIAITSGRFSWRVNMYSYFSNAFRCFHN